MKLYLLVIPFFLLAFLAFAARAQTNLEFEFLHTAQGDFTNATITKRTATYAIVSHPAGISKIWLTNFTADLQKKLGYNATNAAATAAAEQKRNAEILATNLDRKKYQDSLRGPVQSVRLLAVLDNFGQCSIQASNGVVRCYVMDIPPAAKNYFLQIAALKADVAAATAKIARLKDQERRAENTTTSVTFTGDDSQYAQASINRNNTSHALRDAEAYLPEAEKNLAAAAEQQGQATTFNAFDTGLQDNLLPRWQAVQ